ncbi:TPA: phenylalanine--tRNA ligase subunit alpha [Candidatus Woesearchaeota archaeon]|nr:phenylalanine--tRNA ligase subunit alpha [Candidatus Woesearchaeota archaeon]
MDIKNLVSKLHPLERKLLPFISQHQELQVLVNASGLQEIEVMRALQWLENKKIILLHTEKKKQVSLGKNSQAYKKTGLPEKIFLGVLDQEFKGLNVITKKSKLSREEVNACIGVLKRKNLIEIQNKEGMEIKITTSGTQSLQQKFPEEIFLQQTFPLDEEQIIDKTTYDELRKRKDFVLVEELKIVTATLTELGKEVAAADLSIEVINRLTTEMLKSGAWKEKQFRAYDVEINVPKIHGGRKHLETEAIEYIRRIWLDMGFKEMNGNFVQSAFWDLDALFVPQDHPAREMQDTFYLHGKAALPKIWEKIKTTHETGGVTGSKGWRYSFSKEETEQVLLRTHTTVLSAQTIAKLKKEDLPAKFFAIGKVFRNESMDWKHLFEFDQVEGIVVDPKANLQHLKGYLTQFYHKMGYEKVRMRPAHFPYTEPSLEVDVFHPVRKEWVELGGAGIFRPEVVIPLLGFDCPVLAWGQGMARIIAEYWNITDIRDLYRNDLKQLREAKVWIK